MRTTANERLSIPSTGINDVTNRRRLDVLMACFFCLFSNMRSPADARKPPTGCLCGGSIRSSKLECLLPYQILRTIRLVSSDNTLNERVSYNIPVIEMDERHTIDARNDISRFNETGHFAERQVDLRHIARNNRLAVVADARQKHFHLFRRRVLRLVENNECIVKCSASHERDGSDFNYSPLQVTINALSVEHVVESIVKGL